MKYDSMIIGHMTIDKNTDYLGNVDILEGGAVLYSSAAAKALGHKVLAVTKLAESDLSHVDAFVLDKNEIIAIPAEHTCLMENTYFTPDRERRRSVCAQPGDPFTLDDIPEVDSTIYHFAGLVNGDFTKDLLVECSKRGKVAVDVQSFLRNVGEDGTMYFADWQDKKEILPYIDYLKTDAAEAEILTGNTDRYQAAYELCSWGAKEVIITHNTEVIVCDGKNIYACPIKARDLCGRTGRGDTTFASYLTERVYNDISSSLLVATATVSLKMETVGVIKATRKDIQNYIDEFYPQNSVKCF